MTRVSVLIPTFRRPEGFLRAARSVLAQQNVADFELIAVDNAPEHSARSAFNHITAEARIPFRWAHEPRPGVSHARNAALSLAQGDLVAWLDDDEEASPHWLANLIALRRETGAQSVFGPVRAHAPEHARNAAFFENLYSRTGPQQSGFCSGYYGIGNSLQPRAMFEETPFDVSANETGGEDDKLFASWTEAGARFAWAADATVIEHLSADRVRFAHGLKRAFAYGQGPCETAWSQHKYATLARHMSVGAVQAPACALASAVVAIGSPPRAMALADRAARGAGKVFWFCTQRFYGEKLAKKAA
jgi:glycosyltransferase involved in cell wall biosynthesis